MRNRSQILLQAVANKRSRQTESAVSRQTWYQEYLRGVPNFPLFRRFAWVLRFAMKTPGIRVPAVRVASALRVDPSLVRAWVRGDTLPARASHEYYLDRLSEVLEFEEPERQLLYNSYYYSWLEMELSQMKHLPEKLREYVLDEYWYATAELAKPGHGGSGKKRSQKKGAGEPGA